MFSLDHLLFRVVQAPMAGGPSTPRLAAATARAGGLGFLAGGYLRPDRLRRDLIATLRLTSRPVGVNLFVPSPPLTSLQAIGAIETYREALIAEASRYGLDPGVPRPSDDSWEEKLALVMEMRPKVVSFTFGLPQQAVVEELHRLDIAAMATVTSLQEALMATELGMDLIGVQGPEAGGHRATFDSSVTPSATPLLDLLDQVVPACAPPVIAAGGITTRKDAQAARRAGAAAVQAGTAFLLTPEAATSPAHRAALHDPRFADSVVTRSFSGRWARGLANEFTRAYDSLAPEGYPALNQITGPIRAAAARAGDPHRMNLWAGSRWRQARSVPTYEVVHELAT